MTPYRDTDLDPWNGTQWSEGFRRWMWILMLFDVTEWTVEEK